MVFGLPRSSVRNWILFKEPYLITPPLKNGSPWAHAGLLVSKITMRLRCFVHVVIHHSRCQSTAVLCSNMFKLGRIRDIRWAWTSHLDIHICIGHIWLGLDLDQGLFSRFSNLQLNLNYFQITNYPRFRNIITPTPSKISVLAQNCFKMRGYIQGKSRGNCETQTKNFCCFTFF